MKKICIVTLILFIGISSFGQKLTIGDFNMIESLPKWIMPRINHTKTEKDLILDKQMNPFYLEADFNGDGKLDIALCVNEKSTDKKGILIIHGGTLKSYLFGAGKSFAHVGDDFDFIEIWKLYRDRVVGLTYFDANGDVIGTKDIRIDNDAILVAKSESASNLIAWQNDKYVWLHTGD